MGIIVYAPKLLCKVSNLFVYLNPSFHEELQVPVYKVFSKNGCKDSIQYHYIQQIQKEI